MKWLKDWWRRRKIQKGTLKWVRLQYVDRRVHIPEDRGALIIKRKVIVFKDGKVRHDVQLRAISIGGYSYDQTYTGLTPRQYRIAIQSLRQAFGVHQVIVIKKAEWAIRQSINSELWRVTGTKYREPYWELRSWELIGKSYVLKTNDSQDVHKLLMLAPSVGIGDVLEFGRHTIPKTAEDIMMFILTHSEELATRD